MHIEISSDGSDISAPTVSGKRTLFGTKETGNNVVLIFL